MTGSGLRLDALPEQLEKRDVDLRSAFYLLPDRAPPDVAFGLLPALGWSFLPKKVSAGSGTPPANSDTPSHQDSAAM